MLPNLSAFASGLVGGIKAIPEIQERRQDIENKRFALQKAQEEREALRRYAQTGDLRALALVNPTYENYMRYMDALSQVQKMNAMGKYIQQAYPHLTLENFPQFIKNMQSTFGIDMSWVKPPSTPEEFERAMNVLGSVVGVSRLGMVTPQGELKMLPHGVGQVSHMPTTTLISPKDKTMMTIPSDKVVVLKDDEDKVTVLIDKETGELRKIVPGTHVKTVGGGSEMSPSKFAENVFRTAQIMVTSPYFAPRIRELMEKHEGDMGKVLSEVVGTVQDSLSKSIAEMKKPTGRLVMEKGTKEFEEIMKNAPKANEVFIDRRTGKRYIVKEVDENRIVFEPVPVK